MKKQNKTRYICRECGVDYAKWQGKCDACGEWNSLEETSFTEETLKNIQSAIAEEQSPPEYIKDVKEQNYTRFSTGMEELDRVLGGGVVKGSLVLLSGDPGQGKTTLLTQVAGKVAQKHGRVFYVSGEENNYQVKLRAERIGVQKDVELLLYFTENIDAIETYIGEHQPEMLIVDSIQTIADPQLQSRPGSIQQVIAATGRLRKIAKSKGITTFVVGHVTKDGNVAGPKLLEHMVDAVLYLEGEDGDLKLLRNIKNRFASKEELGIFQMEEEGLKEVPNPSELLLSNRLAKESGSAIISISKSRPILLEIQALVVETKVENAIPARTTDGFERNRLNIVIAVLEKKCGLKLYNQNIYVNVVGGMKIKDPGADLGVAMGIVSSLRNQPIPESTVIIGEIGLTGEIRPVRQIEQLVREAEKIGFKQCVLPVKNEEKLKNTIKGMKLHPVQTVKEAIKILFKND